MRVRVGLLVGILCLAWNAPRAGAYCLRDFAGAKPNAVWKTPPVTYKISSTASAEVQAAIDEAFKVWADVACSSVSFTNGGTFDITQVNFSSPSPSGVIHIFWYTAAAGYPTDPKYAAYSTIGHDNDGGISFASIAINAFGFSWNTTGGDASVLDVKNEMIYQVGINIGLDDSPVSGSVLTPTISFGSTARHTLSQDDIDGVVHLYPENAGCTAPAPSASGCGGGSTPPGDGGTTPAVDGGAPPTGDSGSLPPEGGASPVDGGIGSADAGGSGQACSTTDECPNGEICTAEGICVATVTEGDGGCSCRTSAAGDGPAALSLLLLLGALLASRRRARPGK